MIGFILLQSATDIVGHGLAAADIGRWFDRVSDAIIADQRALWVFVLVVILLRGGGPISLDRMINGHARSPTAIGARTRT
jgi:putative oxidoreductase